MIDEKKLIERLEVLKDKCWNRAKKENNINFARKQLNIGQVIGIINNQPKISEWIPCSERLPEEGQEVLLQDYYGNMELGRFGRDGSYQDGFYADDWFTTANNYLAWQPLPAPYEVKSDE